jgi:hypothetical protein
VRRRHGVWLDHAVEVAFFGDLTFEQWLQTFRAMDSDPATRKSVCGGAALCDSVEIF